jgi:hypothetical protein
MLDANTPKLPPRRGASKKSVLQSREGEMVLATLVIDWRDR